MKAALLAIAQRLPQLLLAALIAAAAWYVHALGVDAGRAEVQARWDKAAIGSLTLERDGLGDAIRRTADLGDQIAALQINNHKAQADAKATSQTILERLRSGALRLSIPATADTPAQPGANAGDSTAGPGQARTELDPATSENLVAITDEGDAAIRDLNTCIDAYAAAAAGRRPVKP